MEILFLILGLGALWLGSELVINGVLDVAERHKISHLFLGLTVLTFGTDLPELFIVVSAAIQRLSGIETSDLIVGETLGTSMAQIGLVLGIASFFGVILITKRELMRDGLTMVGAVLLLFIVGIDGEISQMDGVVFMLVYALYFISLFREEKLYDKIKKAPQQHLLWAGLSVIAGFVLLIKGSSMTVDNALLVSEHWGIEQHIIGILIVGLGTSLPELATSLTAVRKGAGTMAAGNLIGSNIFDVLFALGLGASISGFLVRHEMLYLDIPLLFCVSILVLFLFRRHMRFGKKEGSLVLLVYLTYFVVRAMNIF